MSQATITIEDIVRKTTDLPTMPAAALKVIRQTESPTANAHSIAETLSTDQALSVRVLRLANSAYYGLSRQVADLQEAVVILGMRSIKNLSLVAATYPWMVRPVSGYCLGPKAMWTHAFCTAVGAQLVAKSSKKCQEDIAFTAGLMHDLGKVALSIWLENKINAILLYSNRENITFDEAERKILGYDHTQVGEHLARGWNLPEDLVECIRWHHNPTGMGADVSPYVDCVHIGNYLTLMMGFGLGGDGLHYRFDERSLDRLGLKPESLDEIADEFVTNCQAYERMFAEMSAA